MEIEKKMYSIVLKKFKNIFKFITSIKRNSGLIFF